MSKTRFLLLFLTINFSVILYLGSGSNFFLFIIKPAADKGNVDSNYFTDDVVKSALQKWQKTNKNVCDLCFAIIDSQTDTLAAAKLFVQDTPHRFNFNFQNDSFENNSFCDNYLENEASVPLISQSKLKPEEDFPLAFGLMVYHNFEQIEQLLRVIYRPQNYYCFHVDKSSDDAFKEQVIF